VVQESGGHHDRAGTLVDGQSGRESVSGDEPARQSFHARQTRGFSGQEGIQVDTDELDVGWQVPAEGDGSQNVADPAADVYQSDGATVVETEQR
jgi:hypothetical protein